ncbi:MAG: hypothetical protein EBS39_05565, partial [Gammaproteobacteria bacterium]|nr:hypothetical protein [Gammaproteobacteria bacterium]
MSAVALQRVCAELARPPAGLEVEDLSLDSRTVRAGGLFLACAGRRTHGLAALDEALRHGARAVLWEPAPGVTPPAAAPGVWMAPVTGLGRQASAIADRFFDAPSQRLAVTGITGTNGKTTTAWLLAQAQRGAYLGTLGAGLPPDRVTPGELTTADAVTVQRQLAAVRAAGADCVAMEVSSHALDQDRVAAVRFRVAVFTNLTRDHLDYHGTMEAYGAAKARLFEMPSVEARVINVDDAFGAELALRHAGSGALWLACRTAAGREVAARCIVAAALADEVVVTDDNPRSEPPQDIAAEIVAGLPAGVPVRIVHDRSAAIRGALAAAGAD